MLQMSFKNNFCIKAIKYLLCKKLQKTKFHIIKLDN